MKLMMAFVDHPAPLLGLWHCPFDAEAQEVLPGRPMIIVCGRRAEVHDVMQAARLTRRITGPLAQVYDREAYKRLGPAPVLRAPHGLDPFSAVELLEGAMTTLPPVEWLDAYVLTMWRRRTTRGVYQVEVFSVSEARKPSEFDRGLFQAGRHLWDEEPGPKGMTHWIDSLAQAVRVKDPIRPLD